MSRNRSGVPRLARALVLGLVALAGGCSFDKMAADNMGPILRRTEAEFQKGRSVKHAREAAPGLLATLDGIVATSPENVENLTMAAQMNATFAFGFLEEEDPDRARELYEKAQRYAERAVELEDDDVARAIHGAKDATELDLSIDKGNEYLLPPLFWLAFSWGSKINLARSDPKALSDLWRVEAIMKSVLAMDETFFDGGPHLFFAVRYSSFAKVMGGNPENAKKEFEAVDRITKGRHLLAKVLRAQFYAAQLQETPAKATIEQIHGAQKAAWAEFFPPLDAVVKAKDDLWPERNLLNAIAKQRARALLERPSKANIIPPQGVENPYVKKRREEDE